jgi:hypothetical protein
VPARRTDKRTETSPFLFSPFVRASRRRSYARRRRPANRRRRRLSRRPSHRGRSRRRRWLPPSRQSARHAWCDGPARCAPERDRSGPRRCYQSRKPSAPALGIASRPELPAPGIRTLGGSSPVGIRLRVRLPVPQLHWGNELLLRRRLRREGDVPAQRLIEPALIAVAARGYGCDGRQEKRPTTAVGYPGHHDSPSA